MTRSFKTALAIAAFATALPAVAQDRAPRAGAPVDAVVAIEAVPAARRPRAGTDVAVPIPASTEIADGSSELTSDAIIDETGAGLCGRKYCGAAYAR